MTVELFIMILSAISIITGLTVEALKQIVNGNQYNLIAGIVSVALSILTAIGYALWYSVTVDIKYIIFFICIAFTSWLSAMVGFDKVKQSLIQIIGGK